MRRLTNLLFGVPASQEIDSSGEETSFDASKEKACSQEALVVLRLRQPDDDATPYPDDGWQVDGRAALVHDHVGRHFTKKVSDKEEIDQEGIVCFHLQLVARLDRVSEKTYHYRPF